MHLKFIFSAVIFQVYSLCIFFSQPLKVRTENASRLFDLKSAVLAYRAKTMKGFNNTDFCLLFKVYVSLSPTEWCLACKECFLWLWRWIVLLL